MLRQREHKTGLPSGFDHEFTFVIDGRSVTLADSETPILYFVGERDELARMPAVRAVRTAVPRSEIHEVSLPAGHFGLVVGSTSLAHTWPTVVEWMRWRDGGGDRPRLLIPGASASSPGPTTAPGVVVAASEEAGLDLALLGDVAKGALASAGRRANRLAEDAGSVLRSLRYQVPRIGELERMDASSRVGLSQALRARATTAPHDLFFLWRGRACSYAEADHSFDERYRRRCRANHVDFVELDTAEPYNTALLAYLNKRRRLY